MMFSWVPASGQHFAAQYALGMAEWNLIASVAVWLAFAAWLSHSGWAIQRRYFIEASLTPLKRNGVVWSAVLVGALSLIASQTRPAAPAVVALTMMGTLLAYIDARTHRLPTPYVLALAFGVLCGAAVNVVFHPQSITVFIQAIVGGLIWTVPLWLGSLPKNGFGRGDVRLAPILGAMLGLLGWHAALFGLFISVLSASLAALWMVVSGQAGTRSRLAFGPWMIGSTLITYLLWGVVIPTSLNFFGFIFSSIPS